MRGPQCMTFYYHMRGSTMSCVIIYIRRRYNRYELVWLKSEDRGDHWIPGQISINTTDIFQVSYIELKPQSLSYICNSGRLTVGPLIIKPDSSFRKKCCHTKMFFSLGQRQQLSTFITILDSNLLIVLLFLPLVLINLKNHKGYFLLTSYHSLQENKNAILIDLIDFSNCFFP